MMKNRMVWKSILAASGSIAIARIVNSASLLIGMLMITSLGREAMAAGALVTSFYTTTILICIGVIFSVSITASRVYGQGNFHLVGLYFRHGLILAIILSVIAIAIINAIPTILMLFKQNIVVVNQARDYFNYASFGIFPCLGMVVINQLAIALGKSKFATLSILSILPFNILLSYVLIFGKLGCPKFGIAGIAIAIACNFWLVFILSLFYLANRNDYQRYELFKHLGKVSLHYIKELFNIGWPISAQFGMELSAFAIATLMMGQFGTDNLAAQQIIIQCGILAGILPYSISQACSMLVSRYSSFPQVCSIKSIWSTGITFGLIATSIVVFIYIFFPNVVTTFYIRDPLLKLTTIPLITTSLLLFNAPLQLIDCIRNITIGCLNGLRKTKLTMIISIISCWLLALPLSLMLTKIAAISYRSIPIGFSYGLAIGTTMLINKLHKHIANQNNDFSKSKSSLIFYSQGGK